jgi:hypothetical protein
MRIDKALDEDFPAHDAGVFDHAFALRHHFLPVLRRGFGDVDGEDAAIGSFVCGEEIEDRAVVAEEGPVGFEFCQEFHHG